MSILNRAGGYLRGLVVIRNFHVFDVIFDAVADSKPSEEAPPPAEEPQDPAPQPASSNEDEAEDEIPEDFGLIAFQPNVMELNDQVNEAIARRENSHLIPAEFLPVKESWPDICKELARCDLAGASCCDGGILIVFEQ